MSGVLRSAAKVRAAAPLSPKLRSASSFSDTSSIRLARSDTSLGRATATSYEARASKAASSDTPAVSTDTNSSLRCSAVSRSDTLRGLRGAI